ncbi:MAG: N-acetylneuraminate synthase family protein [Pseudorhodoplanes sp.]
MNLGVVLLCRYNSRRLPGKALKEIGGRTVLGHILDRIRYADPDLPVVVATSSELSDDLISDYCRRSGLACFRGALDDVAGRFLACAEAQGWNYAVRVNGDNLFLDADTLRSMIAIAETDLFDLVTNIPGRTFPYGMSVEIVRTSFYQKALQTDWSGSHLEHVTSWLYEHEDVGRRYVYRNRACPAAAGFHLALDTPDDFALATRILQRAGSAPFSLGLRDVYRLATETDIRSPWRGASGPLLIAEIGGNHEGDFAVAKQLATEAIGSGADYVKFQIYRGDTLVSRLESPDRHKHFQRFELLPEQHIELAQMCREAGVGYLSSVWDLEILEWIDPYMDFYKIGSGDMTAWPILTAFAKRGKPFLLSTGLATMDEVLQTVSALQRVDQRYRRPEFLCLLQCTSMYPIPDSDAQLRVMDALRALTGLAVGYSDHTVGAAALRAAAAMGADALEFHFTDNREGKSFRDHKVSLTASEVSALRDDIRQISEFRGEPVKVAQPSEIEQGHLTSFRRGTYLSRSIKAGEEIKADDLVYLRPNHGVDARDADLIAGAKAKRDLVAFAALDRADLA